MTIKILALGDVVGQPGCRALFAGLKVLVKHTKADAVVVNGENAAAGLCLTPELAAGFFKVGVDVITSGNHIWQRREIYPLLDSEDRLLRPANYPIGVPGKGHCLISKKNIPIAIINLEGRQNLNTLRCPFLVGKDLVKRLRNKTKVILIDFHAESPGEKEALALYLDGHISALFGTHTHVQTADEKIFPGGTGFITDLGMTGPAESVIGMKRDISIKRSLMQIPFKMEVEETPPVIMGILLEIDANSGKTISLKRIREDFPALGENEDQTSS